MVYKSEDQISFSTHYAKIWPNKITKRMFQNKNPIQQSHKTIAPQLPNS